MKNLISKYFLIATTFLLICSTDLTAQEGKAKMKGKGPSDTTGVPIDGGAGILLAAGAAYGLKRLKDYHKKKNDSEPIQ